MTSSSPSFAAGRAAAELEALFAKRPNVIKPGLDRITAAMPYLPSAATATPSALIGGTNGKGTTTACLFQLFTAIGFRTGIFTSPHLIHFAERIQVGGGGRTTWLDDGALVGALQRLKAQMPVAVYDAMSFFEVNTLLALAVFRPCTVARSTAWPASSTVLAL